MGLRDHGNHYHLLGVDVSAPRQVVQTAVDRLAERANALAYSSPERSSELWNRIHIIKTDLLSGDKQRSAYDHSLLSAVPAIVYRPVAPPPVPASVVHRAGPRRTDFAWRRLGWAGVMLAAVMASAIAFFAYKPGGRNPAHAVAMALASSGPHRGAAFVSGQRVNLSWTAVPGATRYLVQIAASPHALRHAALSAYPHRSLVTRRNAARWPVIGAQLYYWRVRPYVGGRWGTYTRWQRFAVAQPVIGTPTLLRPLDGVTSFARHMTLCWSAVRGGVGYRLQIRGMALRSSTRTCDTVEVRPGTYRWTVAAQARGVRMYQGAYAPWAVFTVLPKPVLVAQRMAPRKRAPGALRRRRRPKVLSVTAPRTTALLLRPVRPRTRPHSSTVSVVSRTLPYSRPVQRTPLRSKRRVRPSQRASVRVHRHSPLRATHVRKLPARRTRPRVAGLPAGPRAPVSSPVWTAPPIPPTVAPPTSPLAPANAGPVAPPAYVPRSSPPVTSVPVPAGQARREEPPVPPAGRIPPYPVSGGPSATSPIICSRRGCVGHP